MEIKQPPAGWLLRNYREDQIDTGTYKQSYDNNRNAYILPEKEGSGSGSDLLTDKLHDYIVKIVLLCVAYPTEPLELKRAK